MEHKVTKDDIISFCEPLNENSELLIPKSDSTAQNYKDWFRYNIDKQCRILCIDGRIFEGSLHCIDSSGNIILKDTIIINLNNNETYKVKLTLFGRNKIDKIYLKSK